MNFATLVHFVPDFFSEKLRLALKPNKKSGPPGKAEFSVICFQFRVTKLKTSRTKLKTHLNPDLRVSPAFRSGIRSPAGYPLHALRANLELARSRLVATRAQYLALFRSVILISVLNKSYLKDSDHIFSKFHTCSILWDC